MLTGMADNSIQGVVSNIISDMIGRHIYRRKMQSTHHDIEVIINIAPSHNTKIWFRKYNRKGFVTIRYKKINSEFWFSAVVPFVEPYNIKYYDEYGLQTYIDNYNGIVYMCDSVNRHKKCIKIRILDSNDKNYISPILHVCEVAENPSGFVWSINTCFISAITSI